MKKRSRVLLILAGVATFSHITKIQVSADADTDFAIQVPQLTLTQQDIAVPTELADVPLAQDSATADQSPLALPPELTNDDIAKILPTADGALLPSSADLELDLFNTFIAQLRTKELTSFIESKLKSDQTLADVLMDENAYQSFFDSLGTTDQQTLNGLWNKESAVFSPQIADKTQIDLTDEEQYKLQMLNMGIQQERFAALTTIVNSINNKTILIFITEKSGGRQLIDLIKQDEYSDFIGTLSDADNANLTAMWLNEFSNILPFLAKFNPNNTTPPSILDRAKLNIIETVLGPDFLNEQTKIVIVSKVVLDGMTFKKQFAQFVREEAGSDDIISTILNKNFIQKLSPERLVYFKKLLSQEFESYVQQLGVNSNEFINLATLPHPLPAGITNDMQVFAFSIYQFFLKAGYDQSIKPDQNDQLSSTVNPIFTNPPEKG